MTDGDCFWSYAKRSPFYECILQRKAVFGDAERAEKERMAQEILIHANLIVASDETFAKKLTDC